MIVTRSLVPLTENKYQKNKAEEEEKERIDRGAKIPDR